MYKRLFTFGCSYTQWQWPTWADIMAWDLKIESQNWGIGGIGNVGIMHRILECDLKNKFDNSDLIVVLWSHWHREDRYINGEWIAVGNVFDNQVYDKTFIKKYWSLENDIIKNSSAIIVANKIAMINYQAHIMPPGSFETNTRKYTEFENSLDKFYKNHYSCKNIFPIKTDTNFNMLMNDGHPSILNHLNFLKTMVYPSLGLQLNLETEKICKNLEKDICWEISTKCKKGKFFEKINVIRQIVETKYKLIYGKRNGF